MQCPSCGNTDLRPTFNWCPVCGIPLPRAQNTELGEHGVERTVLQQNTASTRDKGDLGLDKKSIQGKFNLNFLGLSIIHG